MIATDGVSAVSIAHATDGVDDTSTTDVESRLETANSASGAPQDAVTSVVSVSSASTYVMEDATSAPSGGGASAAPEGRPHGVREVHALPEYGQVLPRNESHDKQVVAAKTSAADATNTQTATAESTA
ncbi:hypothetical protein PC123_g9297 [Phytophthora cactorum]|nr:hypothetical protein PC123_g9297 [Phytophthora cactorum]